MDHVQKIEVLSQAMWDALRILGSDLDGDPTPAAMIAGSGLDGFIEYFLAEIRGHEEDYDELLSLAPIEFDRRLSEGIK